MRFLFSYLCVFHGSETFGPYYVSVFPLTLARNNKIKSDYELYAENGSVIPTYGLIRIALNFKLRREFTWNFIAADVSKPIIGADFLSFHGLLPDLRNKQLVDSTTNIQSHGEVSAINVLSIKTINGNSKYHTLLAKFPEIKRPSAVGKSIKHNMLHYVQTTPGPPVSFKP